MVVPSESTAAETASWLTAPAAEADDWEVSTSTAACSGVPPSVLAMAWEKPAGMVMTAS